MQRWWLLGQYSGHLVICIAAEQILAICILRVKNSETDAPRFLFLIKY